MAKRTAHGIRHTKINKSKWSTITGINCTEARVLCNALQPWKKRKNPENIHNLFFKRWTGCVCVRALAMMAYYFRWKIQTFEWLNELLGLNFMGHGATNSETHGHFGIEIVQLPLDARGKTVKHEIVANWWSWHKSFGIWMRIAWKEFQFDKRRTLCIWLKWLNFLFRSIVIVIRAINRHKNTSTHMVFNGDLWTYTHGTKGKTGRSAEQREQRKSVHTHTHGNRLVIYF